MKLARERLIYWRYRVNVRNQLKVLQWEQPNSATFSEKRGQKIHIHKMRIIWESILQFRITINTKNLKAINLSIPIRSCFRSLCHCNQTLPCRWWIYYVQIIDGGVFANWPKVNDGNVYRWIVTWFTKSIESIEMCISRIYALDFCQNGGQKCIRENENRFWLWFCLTRADHSRTDQIKWSNQHLSIPFHFITMIDDDV